MNIVDNTDLTRSLFLSAQRCLDFELHLIINFYIVYEQVNKYPTCLNINYYKEYLFSYAQYADRNVNSI